MIKNPELYNVVKPFNFIRHVIKKDTVLRYASVKIGNGMWYLWDSENKKDEGESVGWQFSEKYLLQMGYLVRIG